MREWEKYRVKVDNLTLHLVINTRYSCQLAYESKRKVKVRFLPPAKE